MKHDTLGEARSGMRRIMKYREPTKRLHPLVYALRKRRYDLRLGARAVAERIGYEVDTLQGWEMGRTTPNIFAVEAWAQGLGLKLTFAERK